MCERWSEQALKGGRLRGKGEVPLLPAFHSVNRGDGLNDHCRRGEKRISRGKPNLIGKKRHAHIAPVARVDGEERN